MNSLFRILVSVILVFALFGCGEKKTREIEVGYVGRAKFDPFLAATRFLRANGREADSLGKIPLKLDKDTAVLIVPAREVGGEATFSRLARWVTQGGSLIICLEGAARYDDWRPSLSDLMASQVDLEQLSKRLEDVGLEIGDESEISDHLSGQADGDEVDAVWEDLGFESLIWNNALGEEQKFQIEFAGSARISKSIDSFDDGQRKFGHFASVRYGRGAISVMSHARPWRNRYFADNDHAAFLLQMSELSRSYGKIQFVYGSGGSFFDLLYTLYWRGGLALLAMLVMWLWIAGSRFGPTLRVRDQGHKMTRMQLILSGGFFLRSGKSHILIEQAQNRIRRTIQKVAPRSQDMEDTQLIEIISKRINYDKGRIEKAMSPPDRKSNRMLRQRLKDLQKIAIRLKNSDNNTKSSTTY